MLSTIPPELLVAIFEHLPPSAIIRLRLVCRAFLEITESRSLWLTLSRALPLPVPLPLQTPDNLSINTLGRLIHSAHRYNSSWDSEIVIPRRTLKLKELHSDRITCVKLLEGGRWMFTGSVDGLIRCWDLSNIRSVKDSRALHWGDIGKYAEWKLGADISAMEVQYEASEQAAIVVVGSYYSVESCAVFRLPLPGPSHDYLVPTKPSRILHKANFYPLGSLIQNWCGTQCVSLEGDLVAVGGHLSPIQLLNWRTGAQAMLHNPSSERRSVAALKLLTPYLLTVTRCGRAELFLLPPTLFLSSPSNISEGSLVFSQQLVLARAPITSVSISSTWKYAGQSSSKGSQPRNTPVSILLQHTAQSAIFVLHPDQSAVGFPYAWPPVPKLEHNLHEGFRPESASLGATGARAASIESTRDFRPYNRVVAWTKERAKPVIDDIRDPNSTWQYEEITDLYTEVSFDEALGRICVGTARGGVWIFDF